MNDENLFKILTFEDLEDASYADINGSIEKQLAELLLEAYNDWTKIESDLISDFLDEYNSFLSNNSTIKNSSAWKLEASETINELIRISEKSINLNDLSNIISYLIDYYTKEFETTDFVADLKYKTHNEGGRKTSAFNKYRPHIKFDFDTNQTSGEQIFMGQDSVLPGESVRAKIRMIASQQFKRTLSEEIKFEFREGPNIIGTGIIISIFNKSLKKTGNTI